MDYTIQLMEEPKIILVTISGKWNPDTDKSMGIEIMSKVGEWKAGNVLVDMRELQFDIPVIDIFQRAKDLSEQRREFTPVSSKVALVYHPKDRKTVEDFTFFENTAQNRGSPYRVFKEMESALEWLAK
jgi:hypothetical protein